MYLHKNNVNCNCKPKLEEEEEPEENEIFIQKKSQTKSHLNVQSAKCIHDKKKKIAKKKRKKSNKMSDVLQVKKSSLMPNNQTELVHIANGFIHSLFACVL